MSRVFITGSAEGLGHAAALELIAGGHEVTPSQTLMASLRH